MTEKSQFEEFYGVRVSPAQEIPVEKLTRHKLNIPRSVDGERSRVFTAEIKSEGVKEPILITPEFEVLRGWRRTEASRKVGRKTIPARFVEPNLSEEKIRRLIYRDNNLRENYTPEEIEDVIITLYGKDRVLQVLPRGVSVPKSRIRLLPLDREIERDLGIPSSTAKDHLSALRKKLKSKEVDLGRMLKEGEINRLRNAAKEWVLAKRLFENAEKKISHIRDSELLPAKKKMASLENEARKFGKTGVQQFEKFTEQKKK